MAEAFEVDNLVVTYIQQDGAIESSDDAKTKKHHILFIRRAHFLDALQVKLIFESHDRADGGRQIFSANRRTSEILTVKNDDQLNRREIKQNDRESDRRTEC